MKSQPRVAEDEVVRRGSQKLDADRMNAGAAFFYRDCQPGKIKIDSLAVSGLSSQKILLSFTEATIGSNQYSRLTLNIYHVAAISALEGECACQLGSNVMDDLERANYFVLSHGY